MLPDVLRNVAFRTVVDVREQTRETDVLRVLLLSPGVLQQRVGSGPDSTGTLSGRFRVEQEVVEQGLTSVQGTSDVWKLELVDRPAPTSRWRIARPASRRCEHCFIALPLRPVESCPVCGTPVRGVE